ncbi:MAG: hypothetical protein COT73_01880 [Bdellovibrio sp. CG10_big_fil_rev_8_21_14_0_10_47_8]|nr:MAG: hypothetical protein COT73_01880 [Bdellovibrio sp. CG10_big_fil_rev_8_21_14_0_10_47_8]
MKTKLFLILFSAFFSGLAFAAHTGTLYEINSKRSKVLFHSEATLIPPSDPAKSLREKLTITYKDPEGNLAFEQQATLEGSRLIQEEIQQKQLGQTALIEVKDGKVFFTKVVDGKESTSSEKLGGTLVTTGNFQRFVQDHWKEIAAGDTVDFRFGVWDRQETVGFKIFKIGEEKIGADQALVLKMKPTSFLIAALVDPLIFKYKADGSELLEMKGRVAPKQKVGSKWKDLDAEVVYAN